MRKLERILRLGATHCLAVLVLAGCGSEDSGSDANNDDGTSTTANTVGTTGGSGATATSGTSATATTSAAASGGVGVTGATGATGTTGAAVTTGITGFGATTGATTGSPGTAGSTTGTGTTGSATSAGGATSTGSDTSTTGEVFCNATLTGEDFYLRPQSCAHCHGDDALGTEDGPEVRHPNADYLRWIVREGRMDHPDFPEGMQPVPDECLTDAMIEEIITFLNSFPEPTTGAELYADYCANCHGADGKGGVTGVSLDGELHENAGIAVSGHETTNYASRNEYMPAQGDNLTAAEIQLITDYLQNDLGLRF